MQTLHGIIPPMTTPFTASGELDESAVAEQVEFLIRQGVHGLAAGGSTGEGHTLDHAEFKRLIELTVEAAQGRVPVIAGIIVDSTRDAIQRGQLVHNLEVAALQVTPVHYLFRPSDEAMLTHFRTLAEQTEMPVMIYNVVPWSYLSPELLLKIMDQVPGVVGVKQSAGDLKLFADLMLAAKPENLIFSAVDALLYPSFVLGAQGAIAAILAAAPGACVALWDAVEKGNHQRARQLHEQLLPLWNAMFGDNLPACVKYAQQLQGINAGLPRAPMPAANEDQQTRIKTALAGLAL